MGTIWRLLTVSALLANCQLSSAKEEQQKTFHSPTKIDKVLVSGDTIYVGAVNQIYCISSVDFHITTNVSVGPILDSPLCTADGKSCLRDNQPVNTDVHTKILAILPNGLLHCSSVRQGSCTTYSPKLSLLSKSTVPVAANSEDASTVSLLVDQKLMVAASPTQESPYRDPFPAVAMRSLPDLMVENAGDLDGEAAVFLRAAYRNSFRYVYAFTHQHFVFVVAIQTISRQNRPASVTKLIRFCRNDTKFVSYSEIELQCRGEDNTNYPNLNAITQNDDKIIAAFSAAPNVKKSSICIFSMQRIKLTFWYNVDRCRGGTDSIKLAHIGRDSKCINKAHIPLDEDTCELGVGGSIEAVEMSTKDVEERVTSLMTVDNKAVFAGTAAGQIVMMKWADNTLEEYGRKDVGDSKTGSEVRQMSRYGDHVFVQMPFGIVREAISTCSHHSSCTACILSPDPLCQWCHPTQTCTTAARCSVSTSPTCPVSDADPTPDRIPVNSTLPISFRIKRLPPPNGYTYKCVFGDDNIRTPANWTFSGVVCNSPSLPRSQSLTLSVATSLSRTPIVAHNFTIYDCSEHQTCSQCSSSNWKCEWCATSQSCVNEKTCKGTRARACVKLIPMTSPIALGSQREIVLEADNLASLDVKHQHFCRVNVSGTIHTSPATIAKDSIRCSRLSLSYDLPGSREMSAANLTAHLALATDKNIIDVINISLYSCASMAADCSSCLSLSPSLACGWCNGKCSHECHNSKYTVCDPPRISHFEPSSGPMEGGTLVRIYGKDLGTSEEEVRGKVYVAGARCDIVEYQISNLIICRVDKGSSSGPVRVSVGRVSMKTAESSAFYSFVKVAVFSAYPLFGPISGGTKITLYGQNLNCGSTTAITVGNAPCTLIKQNSSTTVSCIAPSGNQVGKNSRVRVSIDRSTVVLDTSYEYRPDPVVTTVYPLVTFKSGGKVVTVHGMSLDSVLSPKMYLVSSSVPPFHVISELAPCQAINATLMTCLTPKMLETASQNVDYMRFPIGFAMDNVTSVHNLGRRMEISVMPDPQLAPFKGVRYHQGEQPLILEGNHLNRAAEPNDFKVFIGSERCYVTLVDIRQLVCSGPVKQPKATDEKGNSVTGSLPLVTVIVGTIRTELGLLEYADQHLSTRLWIMVLVTLFAMMCVIGALCIVWRRRRQERERDYRKIQMQMESFESNVRKECKQAFAELQTTLAPLQTSHETTPPLLPFSHFVENLLWSDGLPVATPTLSHTLPVTLAQFHALLTNKTFIFAIVEAAESDSSMSPGERAMLSSLLVSVLLRNFAYCTEIIIDLLRAHIAKTVHSKNSEMLFRKSDSVVEKMVSKWMSICLHSHVMPHMHSFFFLYKALKYQTEKGPVDAVTGAARYTINESKLLRESVDSTSLTIYVVPLESGENVKLDVHACDAICQLKQKIAETVYSDIPYSQRPDITQFDLQIKCPRRGLISLQDVSDLDSQPSKGPTKLKTVSDYGITNDSVLQMTPASCRMDSYRKSLADSGQSSWSSLDRCSPTYSSLKYYHLVNSSNHRSSTIDKRGRKFDDSIPRSIPEVYLTRLLTSKGTVQSYVDDFLESVLYMQDSNFPPVLKFFFDLLDREAATNSVSESICQQWKSNGYVLRVWANFVKNPRLLFDVPDSVSMDANLSTVAQTLMDCFSFSEPVLGAHSPSSRLLFAKDVARLRPLSGDLFKRIKRSPPLSLDVFRMEISNVANDVSTCKGSSLALSELLSWVRGNGIRVTQVLASDAEAVSQRLPQKLSQVLNILLEPENHIYSTISDYS